MKQILENMNYCHEQNIIHRNLKPENIVVNKDLDHLKIMNFELSDNVDITVEKYSG